MTMMQDREDNRNVAARLRGRAKVLKFSENAGTTTSKQQTISMKWSVAPTEESMATTATPSKMH